MFRRFLRSFAAAPAFALAAGALAEPAAEALDDIVVTAKRLGTARQNIEPSLGASTYTFTSQSVEALPGGEDNALNQIILQAPGVVQDSYGQLHVRGEHNGLQYRLNGIILPEGISVFSQSLSPRLADQISLITGALPAQYGLRTAGIVNLSTKAGRFDEGGEVELYGGSHDRVQPSIEFGGSAGPINYFVSASFLSTALGIESPNTSRTPIHDRSQQGEGFAYIEDILDADSRLALILGTSRNEFQIPNTAGVAPPNPPLVTLAPSSYPSAWLNESQRELTHYGTLSYLRSSGAFDWQVSLFGRYSSLDFTPDPIGDLIYTGIAQQAYKRDIAGGVQAEGAWRLDPVHTLRYGVIVEGERTSSRTLSSVETVDPDTGIGVPPVQSILDESAKTVWSYSLFVQDEWRFLPDWTLNVGLRGDLVDAFTHDWELSPRVNLVWQADPTTTVHLGYARYFTPPPVELVGAEAVARFAGTTAAAASTANDTPKAERANYVDLGVSRTVFGALTVGLDSYYKQSRDLIDEGQFGAPIILTPFNYASGRQYGIELSLNWRQGPWTLYGNVAGNVAEGKAIVTSQFAFAPADLDYIAGHYIHLDHDQTVTASAGVSYNWSGTILSTDLIHGAGLRSDGDHPNGRSLPDYNQVNLGVSRAFELPYAGPFRVRVDVVNLLDEIYEIRDGTGVGVGAPQYGPRRGFFVGIARLF